MKVFRRKRQRNGRVIKSATFYGYVGGKKVNLGMSDKQDAEAELVRRMRDWQRATVGKRTFWRCVLRPVGNCRSISAITWLTGGQIAHLVTCHVSRDV